MMMAHNSLCNNKAYFVYVIQVGIKKRLRGLKMPDMFLHLCDFNTPSSHKHALKPLSQTTIAEYMATLSDFLQKVRYHNAYKLLGFRDNCNL